MRWIGAAAWPEPITWPLCDALGSGPRAEQRESKVVGALEVCMCEGAAAQRTGLVSTNRCPDPGLAHNFGLDPWIADGRGG